MTRRPTFLVHTGFVPQKGVTLSFIDTMGIVLKGNILPKRTDKFQIKRVCEPTEFFHLPLLLIQCYPFLFFDWFNFYFQSQVLAIKVGDSLCDFLMAILSSQKLLFFYLHIQYFSICLVVLFLLIFRPVLFLLCYFWWSPLINIAFSLICFLEIFKLFFIPMCL